MAEATCDTLFAKLTSALESAFPVGTSVTWKDFCGRDKHGVVTGIEASSQCVRIRETEKGTLETVPFKKVLPISAIPSYEVEELAKVICGLPGNANQSDVEAALWGRFDINLAKFGRIVRALCPLTPAATEPLTGELFSGFVHDGKFVTKTAFKI